MKNNRIILAACAAAGCLAVNSASAQNMTVLWNGGGADHDWANAANWSTSPSLPVTGLGTAGDNLQFNTTGAGDYAIYSTAQGSLTYQTVRVGVAANGRLDVTGGTLTADGTSQARIGVAGRTGTLNVAGGNIRLGGLTQIGLDNNSVGVVNVSSGVFDVTRGGTHDTIANTSIALGAGGTGQGTLNMSGGNVYTRFGVVLGLNSGTASGTFHVMGGGLARIGTDNGVQPTSTGFWNQRAAGTLAATVDSSGFTLGQIEILDGSTPATIIFAALSTLDLGFSGAAPTSTMSWDLMTFSDSATLTDNGLTLAAGDAAAGWSFAFVDTGGTAAPNALRITYSVIPEPTVGAIAGLSLLFMVFRTRRRA